MVFLGQWMHSEATGYVPRSNGGRDRWSHWKVVLKRERYSDCAPIQVDVYLSPARKVKERWVSTKRPQLLHRVYLGNLNNHTEESRLLSIEGRDGPIENNPRIVKELEAAIVGIGAYAKTYVKEGRPIETHDFDYCVKKACQKQARAAAA